jgi:C4-dicarboxylate-specific signal transduction histidine kinase
MTSNDLLQLGLGAFFNVLFCGLWALFVERRIRLRDDVIQAFKAELKQLREERIVSIEKRLTGLHASKDRLADEVEANLKSKVEERTLHRELAQIADKIETSEKRQENFEREIRADLRGLHDQSSSSSAVLGMIARKLNVSLPGSAPQD